jgi:hypothetical protein
MDLFKKKNRSSEQELALERKQDALEVRIEKHNEDAARYMSSQGVAAFATLDDSTEAVPATSLDPLSDSDSEAELERGPTTTKFVASLQAQISLMNEKYPILLPSALGHEMCKKLNLQTVLQAELALREGQANDALYAIRLYIGEKSVRFRKNLRLAKSKVQKTRSWDAIHTVDRCLKEQSLIYNSARNVMIKLGADNNTMSHYQVLTSEDLKVNTAIVEPNARGQHNVKLSWIWTMSNVRSKAPAALLDEGKSSQLYEILEFIQGYSVPC